MVSSLWLKIDQMHVQYMDAWENETRLMIRKKLVKIVTEYLSLVPFDRRFVARSTGDLISNTIKYGPTQTMEEIASGFNSVEECAAQLLKPPTPCPQVLHVDQRSKAFQNIVGADKLFLEMGFTWSGTDLSMPAPRTKQHADAIMFVARDCLLASVECSIFEEILTGARETGLALCSLQDIDKLRRETVGTAKQAIMELILNREMKDLRKNQEEGMQEAIRENQENERKMAQENKRRLDKVKKENKERMKLLKQENQNNIAALQDMHQGQLAEVVVRHAEDRERGFVEKETNSDGNRPEVPECPICFEEMAPPVRIF